MSRLSEPTSRWVKRGAAAFAVWAVVVLAARVLGNDPRPVLIGLGVAAFGAVLWLFLDVSAGHAAPAWDRTSPDPVHQPGEDPRLALLTRVIAQHLDAYEVSDTLRRHLVELAEHRLVASHGIAWRADPARAEPVLGPELSALARQQPPYPRMDLDHIDVLLRRIEAL